MDIGPGINGQAYQINEPESYAEPIKNENEGEQIFRRVKYMPFATDDNSENNALMDEIYSLPHRRRCELNTRIFGSDLAGTHGKVAPNG